jgi:hypothetical protein
MAVLCHGRIVSGRAAGARPAAWTFSMRMMRHCSLEHFQGVATIVFYDVSCELKGLFSVHHVGLTWSNAEARPPPMSALGQKQTYAGQNIMSALTPKADMCGAATDVHYGPKADIRNDYDRSDKHPGAGQNHPDFGELAGLRIDLD